MTKKNREYWSLKNRIGYAVIRRDKKKQKELEKELKEKFNIEP